MSERLKQAEQDVVQARSELSADVGDLLGWFDGVTPLMELLNKAPQFRHSVDKDEEDFEREDIDASRQDDGRRSFWGEITDTVGSNPLPVLLITLGVGLLLQGTGGRKRGRYGIHSRRRDYSRSGRRSAR